VKQEFKLHKDIDNSVQVIAFLSSWQKYLENVMGHTWKEDKLDMAQISQMSDQQVIQVGKFNFCRPEHYLTSYTN
jgi:hypothetical protein